MSICAKPTPEQVRAALEVLLALGDMIREAGQVPAGHLYAALMSKMDLNTFESMIARLVGAKLVERHNHLLVWVGPRKEQP